MMSDMKTGSNDKLTARMYEIIESEDVGMLDALEMMMGEVDGVDFAWVEETYATVLAAV